MVIGELVNWPFDFSPDDKKSAFLAIFLLTLFVYTLKYTYVCQQANINRQQAIDIAENRTNRPAPNRLLPPCPAQIECELTSN